MITKNTIAKFAILSAFSALLSPHAMGVMAAGSHGGAQPAIGKAGDASSVTRTVQVTMHDNYFDIEKLAVKPGETIRFVITNAGEFMHEFNIGTNAMQAAHKKQMAMMMEHGVLEPDRINQEKMNMAMSMDVNMDDGRAMRHDDPNSVLLEPGKSAEIVWKFPDLAGAQLQFACNIPGHAESGMVGNIRFLNLVS